MTPVADKANGETTTLFKTYRQRERERENYLFCRKYLEYLSVICNRMQNFGW
jgi:hypothetical protein